MKVLVTGAAGNLGSAICRALARDGLIIVATDLNVRTALPVPVSPANLLDRKAVDRLARGIDAAVHLGNHPDFDPPDPQMIFNENAAMNMNVFQAAVEGGARKIIFASSIQAISSVPQLPHEDPNWQPPYLPLDGDTPASPTNPYALSKVAAEMMLEYFARVYGVKTVVVRWPWMFPMSLLPEHAGEWETKRPWLRRLVFNYLSFEDAAELVAAILRSPLTGAASRVYLPASRHNMLGKPARELVQQLYPHAPLRKPMTPDAESLIDISRIERETGWSPRE